jgi:hypothetical protein
MKCPAGTPQPGCLLCGSDLAPEVESVAPARILVLAGSHREMLIWANQWGIPPKALRFIHEPYQLRGIRQGGWFVRIGTFWRRRDANRINDLVTERALRLVDMGDPEVRSKLVPCE